METFEATIVANERGGAFVRVPADVVVALGGKGRTPMQATFDGVPYRGSVVSMSGEQIIGLLKAIRADLGKEPGDQVVVTLQVDRAERSVEVPHDLRAALEQAGVGAAFDALSYSHQRECVTWIGEAKKADTRQRRVEQSVERLPADRGQRRLSWGRLRTAGTRTSIRGPVRGEVRDDDDRHFRATCHRRTRLAFAADTYSRGRGHDVVSQRGQGDRRASGRGRLRPRR